jgi:hypothetical protein
MKRGLHRHARWVAATLVLLTVGGWFLPPLLSAERYRRRLEMGLERALSRSVAFGAISFRLLPHPGFTIANAIVREDPAFGSEPMARVDRIDCDLAWRTLWRPGFEISRLRLLRPSLNLVRDSAGRWSLESLLMKSGFASPPAEPPDSGPADTSAARAADPSVPAGNLQLEVDEARLNFKIGSNKKPFAITNLSAQLNFDRSRRLLRFRLAGSPIRTDISLPTPGMLELSGEWAPGKDLAGPLDATLRTRGALLYDWAPLITGRNPEIYGVLDADFRLTGSIRVIKIDGQTQISQLHRSTSIPPADSLPCAVYLRGEFDRNRGRAFLKSLDVDLAESHLHVTGAVDRIPTSPELDLVVALERSRLEDLVGLARRLWTDPGAFGLSGRVDGLLAIQGPWAQRRYGGFFGARDVRLNTPSGSFPVSELAVRIDTDGARLAPFRLGLAPRVELVAEGSLDRRGELPHYELAVSAKALPLRDLMSFARAVGIRAAQNLDAQGIATATFNLAGTAWPFEQPTLTGHAELEAARLLAPLTEPLNVPRARIQVKDRQILVDSWAAVIGSSVFSGRLQHRGEWKFPWEFDVRANALSLDEASLWFDVLGHRRPLPLLGRRPGLGSLSSRRAAASNLFGGLNAKGRFTVPTLTYRAMTLRDFQASIEISERTVRVTGAKFRAGEGRGEGRVEVNLSIAPAQIVADVVLAGVDLRSAAPHLPPALARLRGSVSGTGHFVAHGLTREEISESLSGVATLHLKNVLFGDFDPLETLARNAGWGAPEPTHGELGLRTAVAAIQIRGRRLKLANCEIDLSGARLTLSGNYDFDGMMDLNVSADMRRAARRGLSAQLEDNSTRRLPTVHLTGPLDQLMVTPETEALSTTPDVAK